MRNSLVTPVGTPTPPYFGSNFLPTCDWSKTVRPEAIINCPIITPGGSHFLLCVLSSEGELTDGTAF
jgi:hypothetical protein